MAFQEAKWKIGCVLLDTEAIMSRLLETLITLMDQRIGGCFRSMIDIGAKTVGKEGQTLNPNKMESSFSSKRPSR